jgi:hypothetical protein
MPQRRPAPGGTPRLRRSRTACSTCSRRAQARCVRVGGAQAGRHAHAVARQLRHAVRSMHHSGDNDLPPNMTHTLLLPTDGRGAGACSRAASHAGRSAQAASAAAAAQGSSRQAGGEAASGPCVCTWHVHAGPACSHQCRRTPPGGVRRHWWRQPLGAHAVSQLQVTPNHRCGGRHWMPRCSWR